MSSNAVEKFVIDSEEQGEVPAPADIQLSADDEIFVLIRKHGGLSLFSLLESITSRDAA